MVGLGKVASNLMIDLNPSNTKLRDRAIRIVQEITGATRGVSESALQKSSWIIKQALKTIPHKCKMVTPTPQVCSRLPTTKS
jgi:N-acetylmuramic acid 6-phosphate (MurNAc-6-P) etherase